MKPIHKLITVFILLGAISVLIGYKAEDLISAPAEPEAASREAMRTPNDPGALNSGESGAVQSQAREEASGASSALPPGYPNPVRKIKTATVDMGWQKLVFSNVVSAVEHEPGCVLIKHGDGEFHAWAVPVKIEYETVP